MEGSILKIRILRGGGHLWYVRGKREGKAEVGVDARRPLEGTGDSFPGGEEGG